MLGRRAQITLVAAWVLGCGGREGLSLDEQGHDPPHSVSPGGSSPEGTPSTSTRSTASFSLIPPLAEHLERQAREPDHFEVVSGAYFASDRGTVVGAMSHLLSTSQGIDEWRALRWSAATGSVPIGHLPGIGPNEPDSQSLEGISGDGSVLIGNSWSGGRERAFRFHELTGIDEIGQVQGSTQAVMNAASGDATVVVGRTLEPADTAWRYTRETETVPIEPLPGNRNEAYLVSHDGSTTAGLTSTFGIPGGSLWIARPHPVVVELPAGFETCRWQLLSSDGRVAFGTCGEGRNFRFDATGSRDFGRLEEYPDATLNLLGLSGDGSTVFGHAWWQSHSLGFLGSGTGPPILLGKPSPEALGTFPVAASHDAWTVVGVAEFPADESRPCRWRHLRAPELLELPPGHRHVNVTSVNADGNLVAGSSARFPNSPFNERVALLWDANGKVHVLEDVLRAAGIDLAGAKLRQAVLVWGGTIVLGSAHDADGALRGFVATLDVFER